jgi:hypothetical protein
VPVFEPGLPLNASFYAHVVEPIVGRWRHSCGLLGWGSDVLGYDTPTSTDHGWGPRLVVFVDGSDVEPVASTLDADLPEQFRGWPVRFPDPDDVLRHHVTVTTLEEWLVAQLGIDPRAGVTHLDWLLLPQQALLGVVRGAVYHDGLGALAPLRDQLAWFPEDVELWLVANQWRRVWQEEAFVGRTAEVGDDLGSRLVAGRLVRELMRLCFLFAGRYWPYAKWFGTAFADLPDPDGLGPLLHVAIAAGDHPEREDALVGAYERVAARHNAWGRTDPIDTRVQGFHARPFRVLLPEGAIDACLARIDDPDLRSLPLVGSIDQATDSTDVAAYPDRAQALRAWYDRLLMRSGR